MDEKPSRLRSAGPSSSGRSVLVGALVGSAIGLLAYRFGVLPVTFGSWYGTGMLGGSAVLFLVSRQVRRSASPGWLSWPRAGGSAAVAALLAFGLGWLVVPGLGRQPLSERRFPGFSISLPEGRVAKKSVDDYAVGVLKLERAGGFHASVRVSWDVGRLLDSQSFATRVPLALARLFDQKAEHVETMIFESGGLPSQSLQISFDSGVIYVTNIECESRVISIMTTAESAGRELHRRIVRTLRCTPIAEKEISPGPPAVRIKPPLDWNFSVDSSNRLIFQGPDDAFLFAFVDTTNRDAIPGLAKVLLSNLGTVEIVGDETLGEYRGWVGTVRNADKSYELLLIPMRCDGRDILGAYVGAADPARAEGRDAVVEERGRRLVASARCRDD